MVQKMYKAWDNPAGEWIYIKDAKFHFAFGFGEPQTVE